MPSLADARCMIDTAIAESERIGAKMNIAVVDAGGQPGGARGVHTG